MGRDNISDFTTNLIKHYLLGYTQEFARQHIGPAKCADFAVTRALFNDKTGTCETRPYYLPKLGGDFVLLTPADLLTADETWINGGTWSVASTRCRPPSRTVPCGRRSTTTSPSSSAGSPARRSARPPRSGPRASSPN